MKPFLTGTLVYLTLTVLTGVAYTSAVTIIAQVFFNAPANGSLIEDKNGISGSSLIGQDFVSPAYFWSRPSASDYSTLPSSASNQGPTSSLLRNSIILRKNHLSGYINGEIPADLYLASGSGVDPHISPEAAMVQVEHVAKARNLSTEQTSMLRDLVLRNVEQPQFGIIGSPRINVLKLNLETNRLFGIPNLQGEKHP
jgi:K+-transporting ATPase ATPase C chain